MTVQPRCVHQFHYSTAAGDAVTNHMLWIRKCLRDAGISGEIYSVENKAPEALGIKKFSPGLLWNCDLLLLHHSHGNPAFSAIRSVERPRALVYHNITPPTFFRHDRYIEELCRLGREQLHLLKSNVSVAFGVSQYNVAELKEWGFANCEQLPLLEAISETSEPEVLLKDKREARELLFVGKLCPHKNQSLLLDVLYYLKRFSNHAYTLKLIGRADPVYREYLVAGIEVLGLRDEVQLVGPVTQMDLHRHYQSADAFVCLSQHEGFCVPLIEAMQHDLPIFAVPQTGVAETLGNSGVHLSTWSPERLAQVIDVALSNQEFLDQVIQSEQERLNQLSEFQNAKRLVEIIQKWVSRIRDRATAGEEVGAKEVTSGQP